MNEVVAYCKAKPTNTQEFVIYNKSLDLMSEKGDLKHAF